MTRHRCDIRVRCQDDSGRYIWFQTMCYFIADTPELAMFQAIHTTMDFPGFHPAGEKSS